MLSLKKQILKALVPRGEINMALYAEVQSYASSKKRFAVALKELRGADPALVQSARCAAPVTDRHHALYALTQDGADNLNILERGIRPRKRR